MHRFAQMGIVWLAVLLLVACAKPQYVLEEERPSLGDVKVRDGGYVRNVAMAAQTAPPGSFLRQASDLLADRIVATFQSRGKGIRLLTAREDDFTALMVRPELLAPPRRFDLATTARLAGYHHLMQSQVMDARVFEQQEGIWWFRKPRYYMTVAFSLEVIDTFTAAKVLNRVMEETMRIDVNSYETFRSGSQSLFGAVEKSVQGIGRRLAREAIDAIRDTHWKAGVIGIDDGMVTFAVGRAAGVRPGDRWAVFEGRRILAGADGARFIVPGYRLGRVEVVAVDEAQTRARLLDDAAIQVGDFAVPLK